MLRRLGMTESYSQISLKWHSCVVNVISQKSVVFEEKPPRTEIFGTLRNPASSETLGRRPTDLIGSFTKNPDTLGTKFSCL